MRTLAVYQVWARAGALALLLLLVPGAGGRDAAQLLVIDDVTVVDTAEMVAVPGRQVWIQEGRIIAVRPASTPLPAGTRVVDGRGKFLIPGLWDLHVHLGLTDGSVLGLLVASGVTGVRDLGGIFDRVRGLRERVRSGALVGPRIFTAGTILENPRFIAILQMLSERLEEPYSTALRDLTEDRVAVASPEEARAAVARLAEAGADCIKFRSVASLEILRALAEEARRHGLALVGHAPQGIPVAEAAEAGQRSIEHSLIGSEAPAPEEEAAILQRLAAADVVVVPTLVTFRATRLLPAEQQRTLMEDVDGRLDPRRRYVGAGLLAYWRLQIRLDEFESPADWEAQHRANVRLLRRLHQAGVPILPGTDLGARFIYPGWSLHDELALLVEEVGMKPGEALQAATLGAARLLGLQVQAGTIERGKMADLVLLDANPLESISNTKQIQAVFLAGRYLDRRALDRLREEATRAVSR
jgi:imidazolonepropionase-like amidohydrolase